MVWTFSVNVNESDPRSNVHDLGSSESNFHSRLYPQFQIYDFNIFLTVYSSLHEFIWNQGHNQLPVGLLAQLVEHCTGIAEVMGSNPVQA